MTAKLIAIRRYPVKSMLGESLASCAVGELGLLGDRAYALVDAETGKVISAKNPRKWGKLFELRASYPEPLSRSLPVPPAEIEGGNGAPIRTSDPDAEAKLSDLLGRKVRLAMAPIDNASYESATLDAEFVPQQSVHDAPVTPGTFFDLGAVHLLTTATLDRLRRLAPESDFAVERFRPNLFVEVQGDDFDENQWVGGTFALGDEVRLTVVCPCPRCVMTTLAQPGLAKDPRILRAAVEHNVGNVGLYAAVTQPGQVRLGDELVAC